MPKSESANLTSSVELMTYSAGWPLAWTGRCSLPRPRIDGIEDSRTPPGLSRIRRDPIKIAKQVEATLQLPPVRKLRPSTLVNILGRETISQVAIAQLHGHQPGDALPPHERARNRGDPIRAQDCYFWPGIRDRESSDKRTSYFRRRLALRMNLGIKNGKISTPTGAATNSANSIGTKRPEIHI
jgi:hypothetical protein